MIYIDRTNKIPFYMQIYKQIQNDILLKKIKPGDYLTGSRVLSRELEVGRNTVDNAYAQLAAEGYIESKKGKGFVVLDIFEWKPAALAKAPTKTVVPVIQSEVPVIYDLSYGNFSSKYFPTTIWKRYTNEALADGTISKVNYYQDRQGFLMLRRQLVEHLRQSRGVSCSEGQIIITGGLQHSLELICKLFNGTVAMEEPGYDGALSVFQNNNIPVYPIQIDSQGLMVSNLRKKKDVALAYITPSHQFPTGATMPICRRYELLEWAKSNNAYIFEDDYDSEYRYHTNPIPALQSIDSDERVIYFGTFSKSLSPSARISYIVIPNRLLPSYYEKLQMYHCVVPWINQYIVSRLIENKHYPRHVRKLCLVFRKRHDLLLSEIKNISTKITVQNPGAGLYLLINFPSSMTCDWLIKRAAEQGVKVHSVTRFWQDKTSAPQNTLFLGFSLIELENIPDCVSRLKKAWFEV